MGNCYAQYLERQQAAKTLQQKERIKEANELLAAKMKAIAESIKKAERTKKEADDVMESLLASKKDGRDIKERLKISAVESATEEKQIQDNTNLMEATIRQKKIFESADLRVTMLPFDIKLLKLGKQLDIQMTKTQERAEETQDLLSELSDRHATLMELPLDPEAQKNIEDKVNLLLEKRQIKHTAEPEPQLKTVKPVRQQQWSTAAMKKAVREHELA
jgi:hypothetical protein